jgi:hypothetical protein
MKLENYHEYVGTLVKYSKDEYVIKLEFQIEKTIELPLEALSTKLLDKHMHQKIGIININGEYRIRKLKMPIDDFKEQECSSCYKKKQCSEDEKEMFYCLIKKVSELKQKGQ